MKFRPILFNSSMVKAIMNGTKTQTRRVIKTLEEYNSNDIKYYPEKLKQHQFTDNHKRGWLIEQKYNKGDIMWVRETTKVGAWRDQEYKVAFDYRASPELINTDWCHFEDIDRFKEFHQKILSELDKLGVEPEIDEENERFSYNWEAGKSPFNWKPSIFMPKEACRNFLKTNKIRVERVQDISEEDSLAEGVLFYDCDITKSRKFKDYLTKEKGLGHPDYDYPIVNTAKESFKSLWISINGEKSWNDNPYVFVYNFTKIEKPKEWKQEEK